jgi:transposase
LQVVTKKLEEIGKTDPRIQRVMTIPGVGPRTAEILVACIDDAKRFASGREVSAYFGLVPRQYQSGETDRNGRITKRGNPLARTILVECAWASLRYNPWAKAIYERISGKQKTRRKKAAIALARKIAVIAWALLRDEKDWEPKRMVEITESFGKMPLGLKETLLTMKPKECRHKRKNRLEREARAAAKAAKEPTPTSNTPSKRKVATTRTTKEPTKRTSRTTKTRASVAHETTSPALKPRRARKLVVGG